MKLSAAPVDAVSDLDARLAKKERRQARVAHELSELFSERADLVGITPAAEFLAESVRWSA